MMASEYIARQNTASDCALDVLGQGPLHYDGVHGRVRVEHRYQRHHDRDGDVAVVVRDATQSSRHGC